MSTYRLDLAYDGTGFHGWAKQPAVRTIQGELESALRRRLGDVETVVAGRTDAGVHARGQVVSFTAEKDIQTERLAQSLNKTLAPEIVVWACRKVPEGFSARFSALHRSYRYRLLSRPEPDPFLFRTTWHVPYELDLEAMRRAAGRIVGEHDFASFCRRAEGRSTVRRVLDSEWVWDGDIVEFRITATSFCQRMVRSLVAVGVEIGRGRISADEIPAIIAARDRAAAKGASPPQGLILWEVGYPADCS
ncbi:MAG TPA: tRNA pseudouridine(38-40) synthase TruA [Actinobacteria bacterium]|nr:tRNA pseudouridine synthase A [bacterium BMS3Bbin01]HDH25434.1 tRNA pseudouridine(38-40) synthase TruA [Actinomycetota bacterium]